MTEQPSPWMLVAAGVVLVTVGALLMVTAEHQLLEVVGVIVLVAGGLVTAAGAIGVSTVHGLDRYSRMRRR